MKENGIVYLVGAGPGDPGLITVRGAEVLKRAEVIAYDRLVHPALLDYASPTAELVYVGKSPGSHTLTQADINRLLIAGAADGKTVARLKGGDPFVFGRGAEEAEALAAAGIRFEIVPGVTSAVAGPAYAGIPLTYRDVARGFAVVTGHLSDPLEEQDWMHLAHVDTLVVLMGLGRLDVIARHLMQHGRSPKSAVAVIRAATTPNQEIVTASLDSIARNAAHLSPPAIVVVGDVVKLGSTLDWFRASEYSFSTPDWARPTEEDAPLLTS